MDISSTLLGISLLLVFIAPIVYLIVNQSRQEKAGKTILFTAASNLNLELSKFDVMTGLYLGLDNEQRKLLFLRSVNQNKSEVIDLKGSTVQLIKQYQDGNSSSMDELREISLEIDCLNNKTMINFYRSGHHPVTETSMRLQKALAWEKALLEPRT